ncbi:MAG: glycosyltransferase family 39 protein, partial [Candidatus Omnitrophica bacterium]|nr:glycosyltransferase family 39 protein [Candidatus Omnitrophota bacterium]
MSLQRVFVWCAGALILAGVIFRWAGINDSDFIFYDEGYYLDWNRPFGEALAHHRLTGLDEVSKAAYAYVSRCLASGKTLWFMIADSRIFFGGLEQWSFSRVWAAIIGVATLALTFLFAKKFFKNKNIALGATALLAVLPSHVFYSRIGMQESLSTILVLSGFYFYLFPPKFGWRTFAAGFFWGMAYFSNYRLIMLPVMITFCEMYLAFSHRRYPDVRKWLWAILIFLLCVFG